MIRILLFILIITGMIFMFASIRSGLKQGASLTLKVILSVLAFVALLLLLLVVGGLFG